MPEFVGFQTMVILDPYGITFNAVGVFGLDFQLLFKSGSSYCDPHMDNIDQGPLLFTYLYQSIKISKARPQ